MPIDIVVRVTSSGQDGKNFVGTMRVNFPEMDVLNRQLRFMASKKPDGLHVVVFRHHGDVLFSIDNAAHSPVSAVTIDDKYGRRNITRLLAAFDILIGQAIERSEEALTGDDPLAIPEMYSSFHLLDASEDEEEIVYLMCRPPN